MSALVIDQPIYVGRMARKRLEAERVRRELAARAEERRRQAELADRRNRRSNTLPMPRPGAMLERLGDGMATYVLLEWETGRKVGRLAGERSGSEYVER